MRCPIRFGLEPEFAIVLGLLQKRCGRIRRSGPVAAAKGVTEETTTGVHRLYQMLERGELLFPAINVNDSVKSKFDNFYGCRSSTASTGPPMIGGKTALVMGYGDVGKGCAQSLRARAPAIVTEIDPSTLQAAMEGYQVSTLDDVIGTIDIFCGHRQRRHHHRRPHGADEAQRHRAISATSTTRSTPAWPATRHRQAGRSSLRSTCGPSDGPDPRAGRGAAGEPGCAIGHRAADELLVLNQVLAQVELFTQTENYPLGVYVLPKHLDEKVASLHLDALGVKLTKLTDEQAEYLGVPPGGPYKPDHYRY